MDMETETRTLKCSLTKAETQKLLADAARMTVEDKAAAQQNIDSAAARLKSAKAVIEALQSTIDGKLDTANRGWENRQVECHWRPDRAAGVKRLLRSDTGEVVETKDMPRQQTIDSVVSSAPKPSQAPELEGVEPGLCGEGEDGRHYRVDAVAPDSVVLAFANGETMRLSAADWDDWSPDPDIDQQEYIDAYESERTAYPPPIEQTELGQKLLRTLDQEGKTSKEIAKETGLAHHDATQHLVLLADAGFAQRGEREGKRGTEITYLSTNAGERALDPSPESAEEETEEDDGTASEN